MFISITGLFQNGFGKDGSHSGRYCAPIWTHSARNGNRQFIPIIPVHHDNVTIHRTRFRYRLDTVQTKQDIDEILIRYSRLCHDMVTIVI